MPGRAMAEPQSTPGVLRMTQKCVHSVRKPEKANGWYKYWPMPDSASNGGSRAINVHFLLLHQERQSMAMRTKRRSVGRLRRKFGAM